MKRGYSTSFLLILILLLAAGLRFSRTDWDESRHLHPDERFLSMVVNDISWPKWTSYFDTEHSPLNPSNNDKTFFVYGTFPIFLTKFAGDLTGFNGYEGYTQVGRALSAFFDIMTVFVLFLFAKRVFNSKAALLSSLLLSITVLHIQHSHFFVVDLFATFFIVLAFYFLILFTETGKKVHAILLGISWGFALSSKLSTLYFGVMVVLACVLLMARKTQSVQSKRAQILKTSFVLLLSVLLICLSAFLVFRIFQPYAFDGPAIWNVNLEERFVADFQRLSYFHSRGSIFVPVLQWSNRSPFFQAVNLTLWGFGIPLSIVCWLGILLGVYLLLIKKDKKFLLPLAWVLFVLVFQAITFVKYLRYMLPGTPFMVFFGGIFLAKLIEGAKSNQVWRKIIAVFLILGCVLWAFAFANIYFQRVSRIQASIWIYDNIPSNSTVSNEHWDDSLPFQVNERQSPGQFLKFENLGVFEGDTDKKIETLSEQLSRTDYIFLTSNRAYKVIPRLPDKYPFTSNYYMLLFNGDLGFSLEKTFTNYPNIFGIEIIDDDAEESFTVYDHPKVLIFKKEKQMSSEDILRLLKK